MSIGSHQSAHMISDVWLTPPAIINALKPFDLDPCSPKHPPWNIADKWFSEEDNGLLQSWFGFVWCNPPYSRQIERWLERMAMHNNGIALIFARTETKAFVRYVWGCASSALFIEGRLHFHYENGERAKANSGAPSVLIGYGKEAENRLKYSEIKGKYIKL